MLKKEMGVYQKTVLMPALPKTTPRLETRVFINRRREKGIVVYPCDGILYSSEKNQVLSPTANQMNVRYEVERSQTPTYASTDGRPKDEN